jgi:hypothetical protein
LEISGKKEGDAVKVKGSSIASRSETRSLKRRDYNVFNFIPVLLSGLNQQE